MNSTTVCVTQELASDRGTRFWLASLLLAGSALAFVLGGDGAWAHGDDEEIGPHFPFGQPGHYDDVDRTIEIEGGDVFFEPSNIEVRAGETIGFVITNTGAIVHEFTIGTAEMQQEHQGEMMSMINAGNFDPMFMDRLMEHNDWNAIMLNPGERRILIWQFDGPGSLEFGCNVPGHYEAGMRGEILVQE